MDGISRSRGWDKEIPHCVLPMEQLVLSDKWARKFKYMLITRNKGMFSPFLHQKKPCDIVLLVSNDNQYMC